MRESFTYGSVGRAPRKRCLYPEPDRRGRAILRVLGLLKISVFSRLCENPCAR
jgi:hypothetical protein